jgi:hypothetical protein
VPIEGQPPDLADLPPGCAFAPRCAWVMERCRVERPPLERVGDRHLKACFAEPLSSTDDADPSRAGAELASALRGKQTGFSTTPGLEPE